MIMFAFLSLPEIFPIFSGFNYIFYELFHFLGKDPLFFHIFFPYFLLLQLSRETTNLSFIRSSYDEFYHMHALQQALSALSPGPELEFTGAS